MAEELMKYPISACRKLWKAVVNSTKPISETVLDVLSPL